MKFNTDIGIGEIVGYNIYKNSSLCESHLLKVVAISFDVSLKPMYHCKYLDTGFVRTCKDCEIEGDPDFDQELGCYPSEKVEDYYPFDDGIPF